MRLARLSERQHGVVTAAQLRALGATTAGIGRRVDAGRLHPIHRGVYAIGHRYLTKESLLVAAVLAVGPDAAISHIAAAALCGLRDWPEGPVDVTVPRP
jgi:hypothetical protein